MQTLKGLRNPSVFQSDVGPFRRFDLVVDHEFTIRDRTIPDFMIALALPDELAAVLARNPFVARRVVLRHQATCANSKRSALTKNDKSSAEGVSSFSASNSGITISSFSMRASKVSAPVASPGTPLSCTYQTRASSSHAAFTVQA